MKGFAIVSALAMALCACGDDENLADPRVLEGGGISDGAIAGRVNVYAVDGQTDEPISGADVYIGEPGEELITGTTDSSGLLQVDDGALSGPTTITVVATGYGAQTWFGANGVNVTIPLTPDNPASNIPQAELSGTIEGWDDAIPDPETNHVIIGVVLYSQSPQLGDEANDLPQPGGAGGLPGNTCVKSALGSQCAWRANVRTGKVSLVSIIIDLDTKGNQDDSDDETTVIGFAYALDITVGDGVDQSGIELTRLDVANLTEVSVDAASPPTGLDEQAFLLGLDLGDSGIAQLGILQDTSGGNIMVPALTGPFASASYQAITFAQMGTEDGAPSSAIIQRGITDLSATIELGAYLPLPADIDETAGAYSFGPVDGVTFHTADFSDAQGQVWGVALLDGRTTFTLPGIDPSPLPSGAVDLSVSAFDGDVDLTDFLIDDFTRTFDRISTNRASVGN